jgi:hypothetical protein
MVKLAVRVTRLVSIVIFDLLNLLESKVVITAVDGTVVDVNRDKKSLKPCRMSVYVKIEGTPVPKIQRTLRNAV